MAIVTCSVRFPGLGRVVVTVDEDNNWRVTERKGVSQKMANEYVNLWKLEAEGVGIAGYKPNRARQWLVAGLGGVLEDSLHRILKDTYQPESEPSGGNVAY